jgi:DNA-binding CsgD family transcriptional regulator
MAARTRRPAASSPPSDTRADVVGQFVIDGTSCVIVPSTVIKTNGWVGGFELSGQHYAIVKIGKDTRCDLLDLLTPRELDIALLIAAGQESKAVARRLRISFHTVRVHLGRIYAKLGLHKQTELAVLISARYGSAPIAPLRARQNAQTAGFHSL